MEDLHSDSLPAAMEGSTSSASPQAAMEASTSASPQVAPIPSRITGIGEGEIQRLIRDLEGLSSSIGELKQGLERLRSPLVALSESEDPSNRITAKCWTKQVRKLCYDTGDYLYDFMHSGNEFKLLGARARDANGRLEWCGIQPQTPSTTTPRHLPAAPRADLIDLGHMVDEVNNLIGNHKELKVVSIVGPEGVGKTTLAKRLYQSVGGNGTFHFRAFLRASPKPDIRRLLTSMFMQIQRKRPSCRLNAYQLIDSIATYLQNKRYFIVIDDLWTAAVWEIISRAFPDGDCSSRIITTTQTKGVALACCGYQSKYVFMMKPLTDAQSENLFFRTVFGSESGCPWHLEEVSREIIRKCGGLPLAIINTASMLPSGLNSEELKSIRDSLPCTPRTNPTPEWMKEVVNLLYSTLRPHLKTCLLYFSMYPEGCIVRKGDLVKQWVVEGFLDGVQGQATEEIARGYFDELVRRGMIQPVDMKNGEVLSCTLHHMIHDVIVNKSMEENFVIIANYFQSAIPLPDKVRRLSVQFGVAKSAHIPESIIMSELRSLAFCGFFQCLRSIAKYRHLRVLILDIWADEDEDAFDLTGIRELLRLRYLKIACNIAVKLPDEIQRQQYLEMLDVDATVVAIPWDIGGLTRLSSIKIAVRELLCKDICFLQILPALTALSVHVKTPPTEMIVLDRGGFLNLKFFTFRCSAPHLLIEEKAMPKIEKLNLCFNAHEARQDGKKPIIIEHLATLKEISVKIGGAAADVDSALANAVTNDPNNPRVQLMESREDEEHGTLEEHDVIMEKDAHEYFGPMEKDAHEYFGPMEKDAHEYFGTQDGGSGGCEIVEENRDDTSLSGGREIVEENRGFQDDDSGKDEHKEDDGRDKVWNTTFNFSPRISPSSSTSSRKDGKVDLVGKVEHHVHEIESRGCSSIVELVVSNCSELILLDLQNVRHPEDADRVKLRDKLDIRVLKLHWENQDGKSVLERLIPPRTLENFWISGYMSKDFPNWMFHISSYLPFLSELTLEDLEACDCLPPFGALPNLRMLSLTNIPNIRKIGKEFYEGRRCMKLRVLILSLMENLVEWWTTESSKDNEVFLIPNLHHLEVVDCPKLKFLPYPPRSMNWILSNSETVLPERGFGNLSSSILPSKMILKRHSFYQDNWDRLQHFPSLEIFHVNSVSGLRTLPQVIKCFTSLIELYLLSLKDLDTLPVWLGHLGSLEEIGIADCPKLTTLPESMKNLTALRLLELIECICLEILPEWLGQLTCLEDFLISDCPKLTSLPESIKNLTALKILRIVRCPSLIARCQGEDAHKISHIPKVELSSYTELSLRQ